MEWKPATIEEVKQITDAELAECNADQKASFQKYRVEPRLAPIVRYGKIEYVVVLAQNGNKIIYWEDVEEGFGVSPINADGVILEQGCNQNDLGLALNSLAT